MGTQLYNTSYLRHFIQAYTYYEKPIYGKTQPMVVAMRTLVYTQL